jgi:hypothetical protein
VNDSAPCSIRAGGGSNPPLALGEHCGIATFNIDARAGPVFQPVGPEPGFEGNRAEQARPERASK